MPGGGTAALRLFALNVPEVEERCHTVKPLTDWSVFPQGYGIQLNETMIFPEDLALWKMKLDTSHQLFVDNYLLAHTENLERETHAVEKHGANPVLEDVIPHYIYPEPDGGYRLYYSIPDKEPGRSKKYFFPTALAQSPDGFRWEKHRKRDSNIVIPNGEILGLFYRPDSAEPSQSWKAVINDRTRGDGEQPSWSYLEQTGLLKKGITPGIYGVNTLWTSSDGIRWTYQQDIGLPHLRRGHVYHAPDGKPLGVGDVLRVRWDPVLNTYMAHTKHAMSPDDRLPPMNEGRTLTLCESDDLVHWSSPRVYAYPDMEDAKIQGMYGPYEGDGFPYESMWLGCISMCTINIDDEGTEQKRNWIRLVGSRDGRHWYYIGKRRAFIPLGEEESWDPHYTRMANLHTTGGPIERNGELWFYYRGTRRWEKEGDEFQKGDRTYSMGVGRLRKDGFVSVNAGSVAGKAITRPFVFEGSGRVHINADAKDGRIRVSVLDTEGNEIPQFSNDSCRPCQNDALSWHVTWTAQESIQAMKDRYIRLRFYIENAKLYSFWIE